MIDSAMNVGLLADEFNSRASGARVCQHVARLLLNRGHRVTVYSLVAGDFDPGLKSFPEFEFIKLEKQKVEAFRHLKRPDYVDQFERHARDRKHDVVHFLQFGYNKSWYFLEAARNAGARTVTQEFIYSSYCARGKDSLDSSGPCGKCQSGNFWNAIRHRCGDGGVRRPIEAYSRRLIRRKGIPLIDAAIATCTYMKHALHTWGVEKERIYRSPLPFETEFVDRAPVNPSDYWVFSSTFNHEKGVEHLQRLVNTKSAPKIWCLFLVQPNAEENYARFLEQVAEPLKDGRIVTDRETRFHAGGKEIVADAIGYFLPTVWPSSTEYTLMEAMGLGKPLVTFNTGVQIDILKHRYNAMVYDVGDLEGVLAGMQEIGSNPDLRLSLSRNSRETFERVTHPDLLMECLMNAYTGSGNHAFSGKPDFATQLLELAPPV